jgi:beta-galactosidase
MASLHYNKKMYYHEIDNTAFPSNSNPYAQVLQQYAHRRHASLKESIMYARRESARVFAELGTYWWFDMFGGWYHDPVLMETLVEIREIMEAAQAPALPMATDVIFFADELAHANICLESPAFRALVDSRLAMGNTGVPYDAYMVEDAQKVLAGRKAAVFPSPIPSEAGKKAMALCKQMGIPYLTATPENHTLTTEQIVAFLRGTAVHFYCDTRDVIYAGNGYLAIHAATAGKKHLHLPFACEAEQLFGPEATCEEGALTLDMPQFATALFRLRKENGL